MGGAKVCDCLSRATASAQSEGVPRDEHRAGNWSWLNRDGLTAETKPTICYGRVPHVDGTSLSVRRRSARCAPAVIGSWRKACAESRAPVCYGEAGERSA